MRVPQAMSTNRARAVIGDGTTAVSARFAVPEEVEADDATGGRAGESGRVMAIAPTALRQAAAAAAAPTARRRPPRWRRTARANDGSNVAGRGSASAVSCSTDTLDIKPGRPAS